MISGTTNRRAIVLMLAAALGLGLALPAHAQSAWAEITQQAADNQAAGSQAADSQAADSQAADSQAADSQAADSQAADNQETPAEAAAPATDDPDMKDIDVSKLDWSQLDVDAATLARGPASKARSAPGVAANNAMTWSENKKPDGASGVSVKQSVSPFLDTRVGADMTVAPEPTTMSELLAEKSVNGGNLPQSGGTAWAAITAPGAGPVWDRTAVEARVDPNQEQSRLGTTISKSVPLDQQYSLTLQNGYNVTQQGIVPVPGIVSRPTRSYETDQSAQLSITDTGTSVTAGQTLSSTDDKWLRRIGAEQKLLDGVSVSGSIGETSQGNMNKSISAGFKRSW
jgi:hypothetical protein